MNLQLQLAGVTAKTCRICGETKPIQEFAPAKVCRDGYRRVCRVCRNAQELARHHRNPDLQRRRTLKYRYGITSEEYEALLDEQSYACAVCGTTQPTIRNGQGERFGFHIDHDHDTGAVRGLLCFGCNNGIGLLKTPEALRAAADYLERS